MSEDTNKSQSNTSPPLRSAREEARAYGIDVDLLDDNLKKTPTQRAIAHRKAINFALKLQKQTRGLDG